MNLFSTSDNNARGYEKMSLSELLENNIIRPSRIPPIPTSHVTTRVPKAACLLCIVVIIITTHVYFTTHNINII